MYLEAFDRAKFPHDLLIYEHFLASSDFACRHLQFHSLAEIRMSVPFITCMVSPCWLLSLKDSDLSSGITFYGWSVDHRPHNTIT